MKKINVAELLKDCPKGMELDCTMFDDVVFDHISTEANTHPIFIKVKNSDFTIQLTMYGQYMDIEDAKCVIFPKGKTTWEEFHRPIVEGDIVSTEFGIYIGIVKSTEDNCRCRIFCSIDDEGDFFIDKYFLFSRLATEEEKEKLFDAIKANGYRWNSETKTLEKLIEPKFKVGDRIKLNNCSSIYTITDLLKDKYRATVHSYYLYEIEFERQDAYKLVPNEFDINTLVPFESRVLVRNADGDLWKPAIFGCYIENKTVPYYALGGTCWHYCIPYEMNEHLLGTTDDCDAFYKTWK